MELKEFIKDILRQMDELRSDPLKQKYMVKELEFELSLSEIEEGKIGVSLFGIGGNLNNGNQNNHKVIVKLAPSINQNNKIDIQN